MKITDKIKTININDIHPYAQNVKIHSPEQIQKVKKSIEKNGYIQHICVDVNNVIVIGHCRHLALLDINPNQDIEVMVLSHLDEVAIKKLRILDNKIISDEWDSDMLQREIESLYENFDDLDKIADDLMVDLGFEEKDIFQMFEKNKKQEQPQNSIDVNFGEDEARIDNEIKQAEYILFQFSGGKDSCLVLDSLYKKVQKYKIPYEAIFIETGAEFPDLVYFNIEFCKKRNIPFRIVNSKHHIVQYYADKRKFPDGLYRDCIHKFINEEFNILALEKNALIIRGGRNTQKTRTSGSNFIQIVKFKKKDLKLLNPFFNIKEVEYIELLKGLEVWKGYELGFKRTACWMCPFQTVEQWDALKKFYPLLWLNMKDIFFKWEYKVIKKDNLYKKLSKYWKKEEF